MFLEGGRRESLRLRCDLENNVMVFSKACAMAYRDVAFDATLRLKPLVDRALHRQRQSAGGLVKDHKPARQLLLHRRASLDVPSKR